MSRCRWYRAELGMSLRQVGSELRGATFTHTSSTGFLISRAREDRIEGRYIEKLVLDETLVDPFGRTLSFPRVDYRQLRFRIHRTLPQLEIQDAPTGAQGFFSRLQERTRFTFSFSPLDVDLLQWIKMLRDVSGEDFVVDLVHVSDLELAPGVRGGMTLSGPGDILGALKSTTMRRSHSVRKVRLRSAERSDESIYLHRIASARTENSPSDRLDQIRLALGRSVEGTS